MTKNKIVYVALSFAVSGILIWLLLSFIDTRELVWTLKNLYIPALMGYMAVSLSGTFLRAWRYRIFLSPERIGWGHVLMATFIRNSFVDLLPARVGSLSFIYILNRRMNFSFETATTTFISAFVYDFLTLSPFIVFGAFAVGLGTTSLSNLTLVAVAVVFFLVVLAFFWKITEFFALLLRLYRILLRRLNLSNRRWAALAEDKLQGTIEHLRLMKKTKRHGPIFLLSLAIRMAKYASLFLLLFSLLRSHGFTLAGISFSKLILGTTGAELTSALPIKGLAGFGTWESAWALTMQLMGIDAKTAILSGLGVHFLTNAFEYTLGIASLLILALPWLKKNARS